MVGSEIKTHLNDQIPDAASLILSVQKKRKSALRDDILKVKPVLLLMLLLYLVFNSSAAQII